jgi:hypothetical protein
VLHRFTDEWTNATSAATWADQVKIEEVAWELTAGAQSRMDSTIWRARGDAA